MILTSRLFVKIYGDVMSGKKLDVVLLKCLSIEVWKRKSIK